MGVFFERVGVFAVWGCFSRVYFFVTGEVLSLSRLAGLLVWHT